MCGSRGPSFYVRASARLFKTNGQSARPQSRAPMKVSGPIPWPVTGGSLLSAREGDGSRPPLTADNVPWWAVGSRLESGRKGRLQHRRDEPSPTSQGSRNIKKIRLVWSDLGADP